MPTLIKDGAIATDSYIELSADDVEQALPDGNILVDLASLRAHQARLLAHEGGLGVRLKPDELAEQVVDVLNGLDLVTIEFPSFADGRGYSTAYLLRTRYGFSGELRAVGDIFKDTLFYQQRVGFNAFVLASDVAAQDALAGLNTFRDVYHASADVGQPLFLRRASL